jgi:hypothetical protein
MQGHSKDNTAPARPRTLTLRGVRAESLKRTPAVPTGTEPAYWYVWAPDRRKPKERHPTFEAADAEATRLAGLNPGVRFDVYAAYCVAKRLVSPT